MGPALNVNCPQAVNEMVQGVTLYVTFRSINIDYIGYMFAEQCKYICVSSYIGIKCI